MAFSWRLVVVPAVVAIAGAWAVAVPLSASAEVIVVAPSAPPPPVRYEAVPAPRVGYVWDRGHWA